MIKSAYLFAYKVWRTIAFIPAAIMPTVGLALGVIFGIRGIDSIWPIIVLPIGGLLAGVLISLLYLLIVSTAFVAIDSIIELEEAVHKLNIYVYRLDKCVIRVDDNTQKIHEDMPKKPQKKVFIDKPEDNGSSK